MTQKQPNPETQPDIGSYSALRVLVFLRELQRRWCTIGDLAKLAEVNLRTARRDIATIRHAGFRLRRRVEEHGRIAYTAQPRAKRRR